MSEAGDQVRTVRAPRLLTSFVISVLIMVGTGLIGLVVIEWLYRSASSG